MCLYFSENPTDFSGVDFWNKLQITAQIGYLNIYCDLILY
jgi:hypothetical protein